MYSDAEVARHEDVVVRGVAHLVRGGPIHGDDSLDVIRDPCRRVSRIQRLEVVLPDRISSLIAVGRPVTRAVGEMNHRNAILGNGPGNVRDHLLNEREQTDVPLSNNVKPKGSATHVSSLLPASAPVSSGQSFGVVR